DRQDHPDHPGRNQQQAGGGAQERYHDLTPRGIVTSARPAIASSRRTRSSVAGCVLNSCASPAAENGLMMNMCAVAGEPSLIGNCRLQVSILRSALASASGLPDNCAPASSAENSRDLEMAI